MRNWATPRSPVSSKRRAGKSGHEWCNVCVVNLAWRCLRKSPGAVVRESQQDCRRRPRTAIMCGRGILCTTPRFEEARCACSMSWMNILASACASMWSGASMPVRCARSWHASLKSMEPRNTSAVTTAASSSSVDCVNGWPRTRSGPSTSRREARGRMATSRASMPACAKNA